MKKVYLFLMSMILTLSFAHLSHATLFQPSDPDIGDLDHHYYYTWGIDWTIPEGETVTSVTLKINHIKNWDNNPNDLYVHLLDLDPSFTGISKGWDNQKGGDQFAGDGILINQWHNLSTTPVDLTYSFTEDEINTLVLYASDGNFGLGFDPDCHYYNNGVTLEAVTAQAPVPEPSTMMLLGSGLVGLFGLRNRFRRR